MLPYAREYAIIYIPGAILNIFNVCMNNLVVAEGRAKLNLAAMLIGCGLNAALDPVMIYGLGLGVAGASIATVISQALTTAMYLAYILMGKSVLHISIRNASLDPAIFKAIFSVGVPIMMFQSVSCLSMALTNAAAKPCGDAAIAAVGAVTRIMSLGSYVVFGFIKGFQPLVGYNYGARQYGRVCEAIRVSLVWSTLFCSMAAFVFYLFPESVVSIFSKEAGGAMVGIGVRALRASAVVFPVFGLQIVFMVLFLALGKAVRGGVLSISRQGLFFVPLILLLPRLFGLDGLIWVQPAAAALSAALTLTLAIP